MTEREKIEILQKKAEIPEVVMFISSHKSLLILSVTLCATYCAQRQLTGIKGSTMKTPLITREGYEKLKKEMDYLWREERPEVTKKVTWAASLGDRSENADYQYNKKHQVHFPMNLKVQVCTGQA